MILCRVSQIPLMLDQSEKMFPIEMRKASDLCSSIYIINHCSGTLSGPIYGGYMNYLVGYRTSCDILAIILISYSLIFYIFTKNYDENKQDGVYSANETASNFNCTSNSSK